MRRRCRLGRVGGRGALRRGVELLLPRTFACARNPACGFGTSRAVGPTTGLKGVSMAFAGSGTVWAMRSGAASQRASRIRAGQ